MKKDILVRIFIISLLAKKKNLLNKVAYFADYKEKVIELLQRITTVSIETMKIIREMEKEKE